VSVDFNKAKKRSWKKYLVVLKPGMLMFYKDKRGENPMTVLAFFLLISLGCWTDDFCVVQHNPFMQEDITEDSFVAVASDYKKRKYVMRFLPARGREMFLDCETEPSMNQWIAAIEACIQEKRNPQEDLINLNA